MKHTSARAASLTTVLGSIASLAASLVVAPPAHGSEVAFTERVVSTTFARGAASVFAVDLDGDGDIDVLSASQNDHQIRWYESDGGSPPSFTERVISTTAERAASVVAADLDGDGNTDVISASWGNNKIAWYESDGGSPPTFTERVISLNADNPYSVVATDLDGDGDIDVLSASTDDDKIAWYENDGGSPPTFTERVISTSASGARSVFATDLDGDGNTDVLSASRDDDKIAWYENDGGSPPNFTERIISTSTFGAFQVSATDLDGDGDTDVLSTSIFNSIATLAWYENDGGLLPIFTKRLVSTDFNGAIDCFPTDVDGDGDTDILVAELKTIAWYESDGGFPPTFTRRMIWHADGANSVSASDLDGDGDVDALAAVFSESKIAWYENTPCADVVLEVTAPDSTSHAEQSKNRFLSIVQVNEGHPTALRVTLTSSSTFPGDVGKQWWVGSPQEICENSGDGIAFAPASCGPAPGIPMKTFWSSELVCNQECHQWHLFTDVLGNPLEVLHIRDSDIAPGSVYEVQAINCQCDASIPNHFSAAVPVATSQWGDTTRVLPSDCPRALPDGSVDLILDCVAILEKFTNNSCAMLKSRADVEPHDPDLKINITDVLECVFAFSGASYPYPAPVGCP